MLDFRHVCADLETVAARLATRGKALDLTPFKRLADERSYLLQEVETSRRELNELNRQIKAPAFPAAFPWFNTQQYWQARILELREQIALMDEPPLAA